MQDYAAQKRRKEEEQSLKLVLGQPWVWSVSDFAFLASVYEGDGQSTPSSSHLLTNSVLVIAELAMLLTYMLN